MENETSKASFLGVGLVMLVAVVVIGLAVFAIARGILNSSQTKFVNTMDGAENAGLKDYDGTTVSGVKLRGALEEYEGESMMILVHTKNVQKILEGGSGTLNASTAKTNKKNLKVKEHYGDANNTKLQIIVPSLSSTSTGTKAYCVYNAQAWTTSATDLGAAANAPADPSFTALDAGYIEYNGEFATDSDGYPIFNPLKTNWKQSGCSEFISNSAKFACKLVKDEAGVCVGIMFTEIY